MNSDKPSFTLIDVVLEVWPKPARLGLKSSSKAIVSQKLERKRESARPKEERKRARKKKKRKEERKEEEEA